MIYNLELLFLHRAKSKVEETRKKLEQLKTQGDAEVSTFITLCNA